MSIGGICARGRCTEKATCEHYCNACRLIVECSCKHCLGKQKETKVKVAPYWIVVNVTRKNVADTGEYSDPSQARTTATRLAKENPGVKYGVFKLSNAVIAADLRWEDAD